MTSTVFKCASVQRGSFDFKDMSILTVGEQFSETRNINFETGNSNYPLVETKSWCKHGLVATVEDAYNRHIGLELSPDDFWVLIAQGVALYLSDETKAEKNRTTFVNHEGKKDLNVDGTKYGIKPLGLCKSDSNQTGWVGFVEEISDLIKINMKTDFADVMTKPFSTTGPLESQVFRCCLMEAAQRYFSYRSNLCCGIPEVCLHGTVDDYENIKERVSSLSKLLPDLKWWFEKIHKVMDNLIISKTGKPDIVWWNCIVNKTPGGSGGPVRLSGWLGHFFPFCKAETGQLIRNENGPEFDTIQPGLTYTPVILGDQQYTFKQYNLRLSAGFLGAGINKEAERLRPVQGWMMFYE